jgi:hypothetical protein
MQRSLSLNRKDSATVVEIFIYRLPTCPQINSCDCGQPKMLMSDIFGITSDISMTNSHSLLCIVNLIVRPLTPGSVPFTDFVCMDPFTIMLRTLAKKISMNLLTLRFISMTMIQIFIIGSASVVTREKTEQKNREVICKLVGIFNSGINPYLDHLRSM